MLCKSAAMRVRRATRLARTTAVSSMPVSSTTITIAASSCRRLKPRAGRLVTGGAEIADVIPGSINPISAGADENEAVLLPRLTRDRRVLEIGIGAGEVPACAEDPAAGVRGQVSGVVLRG